MLAILCVYLFIYLFSEMTPLNLISKFIIVLHSKIFDQLAVKKKKISFTNSNHNIFYFCHIPEKGNK